MKRRAAYVAFGLVLCMCALFACSETWAANVQETVGVTDTVSLEVFPVVEINVAESVGVSDGLGTLPSELMDVPENVRGGIRGCI
jgi:hypothetical protein